MKKANEKKAPQPIKKDLKVGAIFAYERFESNFNSDVSSFLMLKNKRAKPVEAPAAPANAAAAAPGSTMDKKGGKKKK
jgi:hypothetical protein